MKFCFVLNETSNSIYLYVVMANLGQVMKKQVSDFDFKKPGYPGRVLGFQNCKNLANLD